MTRLYVRAPSQWLPNLIFPVSSFIGLMDLKIGCSIITLFALFNKIAGVYGIIAVFQGGTFAQLSLYVYSIGSILGLLWGLKGISDEVAPQVLLYSHLFIFDHLLSTTWVISFFMSWYYYTPHDGTKPQLAPHQAGLMELIENIENSYEVPGSVKHHVPLEGEARKLSAEKVWSEEKDFAAGLIIAGWFVKIYFALVLYSFALHLRHSTYHSLPLTKLSGTSNPSAGGRSADYRYHPVQSVEEELPAWSDGEDEDTTNTKEQKEKNEVGKGAVGEAKPSRAIERLAGGS